MALYRDASGSLRSDPFGTAAPNPEADADTSLARGAQGARSVANYTPPASAPGSNGTVYYNTMPDQQTLDILAGQGRTAQLVPQTPPSQPSVGGGFTNPFQNQTNVTGSGPLGSYGLNGDYYADPNSAAQMAKLLGTSVTQGAIPGLGTNQGSPFTNPLGPMLQGQNGVMANPAQISRYLSLGASGALDRDTVNAQIYRELTGAVGPVTGVPDYVKILTGAAAPDKSLLANTPAGVGQYQIPAGTPPYSTSFLNPPAQQNGQQQPPAVQQTLPYQINPFSFDPLIAQLYGANPLSLLGSFGSVLANQGSQTPMANIAAMFNSLRSLINPSFGGSGVRSPLFWDQSSQNASVPLSSFFPYFF